MLGRYCSSRTIAIGISGVVAALCLQLWAFSCFGVMSYTFSNYRFDEIHIFCNESRCQSGQELPLYH